MVLLISRTWRERDLPAFLLEFLHTQVGNRHRANGHDFHERTKQQAAQDRARERTIVRHGYILHRFTGSEVYRNPRKCFEEVIQLITLPAR